tara:strand:+ start:1108 stop:1326 length:219 start_codon:yes stop_codon:yes gene_type:complete
MSDNKTITIDGTEMDFDSLSPKTQYLVQQVESLNNKIANTQFELDQLSVGLEAMKAHVIASTKEVEEEVEEK